MEYTNEEKDFIYHYSREIFLDLFRLQRGIEHFDKPYIALDVMKGRMIDIFDNYKKLYAVVLKEIEVSNEMLIRSIKDHPSYNPRIEEIYNRKN